MDNKRIPGIWLAKNKNEVIEIVGREVKKKSQRQIAGAYAIGSLFALVIATLWGFPESSTAKVLSYLLCCLWIGLFLWFVEDGSEKIKDILDHISKELTRTAEEDGD